MNAKTAVSDMAERVAVAIFTASQDVPDETEWDELDEGTQQAFLLGAHRAVAAHTAWLQVNGYKILGPGMVNVPTSAEEAQAMVAAVTKFKQREARKPPKLVGLDGKSLGKAN